MVSIRVATPSRQYLVHVAEGLLQNPSVLETALASDELFVISHPELWQRYAPALQAATGGKKLSVELVPPGETSKDFRVAGSLLGKLAQARASRQTMVVALGGGVIGDLSGFVSACYMRGIRFVQIPTTLLAMVDSSVGGKTAVNLPEGKNLVGAFWQPQSVLIDPHTLRTLPLRELAAGMAEVVKYACINDPAFFSWLEQHAESLMALDMSALTEAIARSVSHKARIVAADEHELAERALLNFGHTFGHALESESAYRGYLHGEAVAIGMVRAAHLSELLGLSPASDRIRLEGLLQRLQLPIKDHLGLAPERLLERMYGDKKNAAGKVRCITWHGIGGAQLPAAMAPQLLLDAWRR